MSSPAPGSSHAPPTGPRSGRLPNPLADLRRRAHARLGERIDLARFRHKPLSLLRMDARRVLDQFLDHEAGSLTKTDRDKLLDDVLAESLGFGPLEELFRDDGVKEILILAPTVVIGRKNDVWTPCSVRFRDAEQVRRVLARFTEVGEPVVPAGGATGGFDVRLPNGFRVVAVVPPDVMDQPPLAMLVRPPAGTVAPTPTPPANGSATVPHPTFPSGSVPTSHPTPPRTAPAGNRPTPPPQPPVPSPAAPTDPMAKLKQRLTERIIVKFAAAGVYDLNQIPLPELRRIVLAHVQEFNLLDKLFLDDATQERLALGILSGMNR